MLISDAVSALIKEQGQNIDACKNKKYLYNHSTFTPLILLIFAMFWIVGFLILKFTLFLFLEH